MSLQDTHGAVQYFEDELNFTTTPMGVYEALGQNDIIIVDVRREADFKAGHIEGAINIPFDHWDGFQGTQDHFPGLMKNRMHYVYCYELLCHLGVKAARKFASLGFAAKEMKGGFQSWKDRQYPIEKAE
jgi:rhodanese-related sulfurtransferase